jgi:exodeoxyribonuclease V beta subunit
MVGPDGVDDRGRPCGVFSWRPSAALVTEASDLLAGGAT